MRGFATGMRFKDAWKKDDDCLPNEDMIGIGTVVVSKLMQRLPVLPDIARIRKSH